MHHEHAQMPTSEHTEPEVNSYDVKYRQQRQDGFQPTGSRER